MRGKVVLDFYFSFGNDGVLRRRSLVINTEGADLGARGKMEMESVTVRHWEESFL